jgi:hypothetical protein
LAPVNGSPPTLSLRKVLHMVPLSGRRQFLDKSVAVGRDVNRRNGPCTQSGLPGFQRERICRHGRRHLPELLEVREKLFTEIPSRLSHEQRQFLRGLVQAEPDWSLMKPPHLSAMPAIAWKLANLRQLKKSNPKKFQAQSEALERVLEK